MPDYEARINTKFGLLVVHFADKMDLEKKLDQAAELTQLIESRSTSFAVLTQESVLPGMEGIYVVTSAGIPRIIEYPESQSDIVRLTLFASLRPLSVDEIRQVSGVPNPKGLRMFDTDEVMAIGDKWTLSSKGRTNVSTAIIPTLKEQIASSEKKPV